MKERVLVESKAEYEEQATDLICLKMDGKSSEAAIGLNKFKKQHTITVIKEPNPKYVDHFESGESGLSVAGGLHRVIQSTKSETTLLAIGSDGAYTNTGGHSITTWTLCYLFLTTHLPLWTLFMY